MIKAQTIFCKIFLGFKPLQSGLLEYFKEIYSCGNLRFNFRQCVLTRLSADPIYQASAVSEGGVATPT